MARDAGEKLYCSHLDKSSYKFYNMWPTELSEIALDWSNDAVEEYTVTWAYDYWTHGIASSTDDVVDLDIP